MKILLALIRCSLIQLFREPMELLVVIFFPVIFVILFGLVFSSSDEIQEYHIGIFGENLQAIKMIHEVLENEENLVIHDVKNINDNSIDEDIIGFLEFSHMVPETGVANVNIYTKNSDSGQVVRLILENIIHTINEKITPQMSGFTISNTTIKEEIGRNFDNILPGILAIVIMQSGLFGAIKIANLKSEKVLLNLSVTPLSKKKYIVSELVVRVMVAFIQSVLVLSLGKILFNVDFANINIGMVILWVMLGSAAFISIGYCIVAWAPSAESANGVIQIMQLVMMFLSGVFIQGNLLPKVAQYLITFNPVAYLADGLKMSIINIPGTYGVLMNCLVLLFVAITFSTLSLRYHWD